MGKDCKVRPRNQIGLVWFMVFNATFNNISVISWVYDGAK